MSLQKRVLKKGATLIAQLQKTLEDLDVSTQRWDSTVTAYGDCVAQPLEANVNVDWLIDWTERSTGEKFVWSIDWFDWFDWSFVLLDFLFCLAIFKSSVYLRFSFCGYLPALIVYFLQMIPYERANIDDFVRTENDLFGKVIIALSVMGCEVRFLTNEARTNFLDPLLHYSDEFVDSPPSVSLTRFLAFLQVLNRLCFTNYHSIDWLIVQLIDWLFDWLIDCLIVRSIHRPIDWIMKIKRLVHLSTFFYIFWFFPQQELHNFKARCKEVISLFIRQLEALGDRESGIGAIPFLLGCLAELLTCLMTADAVIKANNTLRDHWVGYRTSISTCLHSPVAATKLGVSNEDVKEIDGFIAGLEKALLRGSVFVDCIQDTGKSVVGKRVLEHIAAAISATGSAGRSFWDWLSIFGSIVRLIVRSIN